ncbi:hypothetical protein H4R34_000929 [Dimargaris verticillata]|uniref:PHD-type domain-containing protein n=1 Tax=Dimargaris verticillata TaxID=2761393 RepID=A0A9W8EEY6_9FUNG|nr:hypothetical protein H4R34_000929 [Dimargaris verticillata]
MNKPHQSTPSHRLSLSPSGKLKPTDQTTLLPTPDTTPSVTTDGLDEPFGTSPTLESNTPCRDPTNSNAGLVSPSALGALPNGQPSSLAQGRGAAVKLDFEQPVPEPNLGQAAPVGLSSPPSVAPTTLQAPANSPAIRHKGAKAKTVDKRPCGCCQRSATTLTQLFEMELCAHCIPLFAVSPRVSRASKISHQHVASRSPLTTTKRRRDRPSPLPLSTQKSVNHDGSSTADHGSTPNFIKSGSICSKKPKIGHTAVGSPSVVEPHPEPVVANSLIAKSNVVKSSSAQVCVGSINDKGQGAQTKPMTANSGAENAHSLPTPPMPSPRPNSTVLSKPCPTATSVSGFKSKVSAKRTSDAMACECCGKLAVRRQRVGAIAVCAVCAPLFGAPPTTRRSTRQRINTEPTEPQTSLEQSLASPPHRPSPVSADLKHDSTTVSVCASPPCRRTRRNTQANTAPSSPSDASLEALSSTVKPPATKKTPTVASYITTGAFMTRNTLKRLTEASHGFVEDFHQFHLFEKVMILQRDRNWYPARLVAIEGGRTLAKYLDHDLWLSEWLSLDSRRLQSMVTFDQLRAAAPNRPAKRHRADPAMAALPPPSIDAAASPRAISEGTDIAHDSLGFTPGGYQVLQQMFNTPSTSGQHDSRKQLPRDPLSNTGAFGAGLFVLLPPFDAIADYACCISSGDSLRVRDGQKQWCNATALGHDDCCVSVMYTGYTNSGRTEAIPLNSPRLKVQIRKLHQLWQREQSGAKSVCTRTLSPSPNVDQQVKELAGSVNELAADATSLSSEAFNGDRSQDLTTQPLSSKLASLLHAMKQAQVSPPLPTSSDPSLQLVRELVQHAAPKGNSQPTFASAVPTGPVVQSALVKTLQQEFANLQRPQAKPPAPPRSSLASLLLAATQRDPPTKVSATLPSILEPKDPPKASGPSSGMAAVPEEPRDSDQGSLIRSGAVGDRVLVRNTKGQWLKGLILDLTATQALIRWPKRKTWFDRTNPRLRLAPPETDTEVASKPTTTTPSQQGAVKSPKPAKSPVASAPKGSVRRPAKVSRPLSKASAKPPRRTQVPDQTSNPMDALQPLPSAPVDEADYDQHWTIYCNCCQRVIQQVRFYCTYCESPSDGFDYESFELCLFCFEHQFPVTHQHPKTSFAMQWLTAPNEKSQISSLQLAGHGSGEATQDVGEMVQRFTKDRFDCDSMVVSQDSTDAPPAVHNRIRLDGILHRKVCAFCHEDEYTSPTELGPFIGPHPFVYDTRNRYGLLKPKRFWAHDACARYSPEVVVVNDVWYNVTEALKRGRTIRCNKCREKGATIGCFHSKCNRSYHFGCTGKPLAYFREGVIFWCPQHESHVNAQTQYDDIFSCDACHKSLVDESHWHTCSSCGQDYFSSFDLCSDCFATHDDQAHTHGKALFETTSWETIAAAKQAQEASQAALKSRNRRPRLAHTTGKQRDGRTNPLRLRSGKPATPMSVLLDNDDDASEMQCTFCPNSLSQGWKIGLGGMLMCHACYKTSLAQLDPSQVVTTSGDPVLHEVSHFTDPTTLTQGTSTLLQEGTLLTEYSAPIEDYNFAKYLTRTSCLSTTTDQTPGEVRELQSLGPAPHHLFSLAVDSSYYDILGKAPRWATHSGSDYHGTWLPQTVRRALLRFTRPNERVLSNFLGRGTDAIESLLLRRKCIGIDINPLAVDRSKKNCSFKVPLDTNITVEHRPIILLGDARSLIDDRRPNTILAEGSFDHILSHPPYKNCVLYSQHIAGDLSRFPGSQQFLQEMGQVIDQSRRLLKLHRRVTLGIGDNRKDCFYTPVSFNLIREYMVRGFEVEEVIVKRQRYCSAFGLGTELCTKFDFLMFTHEFIVTLRKVPLEQASAMALAALPLVDAYLATGAIQAPTDFSFNQTVRTIPSSPIVRTSRPMGTVWTFLPNDQYSLAMLCLSRIVERFGMDGCNWEEVTIRRQKPAFNPTASPIVDASHVNQSSVQELEAGPTGAQSTVDPLPTEAPVTSHSTAGSPAHPGQTNSPSSSTAGQVVALGAPAETSVTAHAMPQTTPTGEADPLVNEPMDEDDLSYYEQERLRKVQQNRKALMSMGLVSDLNDDVADDIPHYELMTGMGCDNPQAPLFLVAVPHMEHSQLRDTTLSGYRQWIVQIAWSALSRLADGGVFAVGVQDFRADGTQRLYPLGLLVYHDIMDAMAQRPKPATHTLRLKELMIAVPDGYAKDRKAPFSVEDFQEETCIFDSNRAPHVPIVHAYYLIFRKHPISFVEA